MEFRRVVGGSNWAFSHSRIGEITQVTWGERKAFSVLPELEWKAGIPVREHCILPARLQVGHSSLRHVIQRTRAASPTAARKARCSPLVLRNLAHPETQRLIFPIAQLKENTANRGASPTGATRALQSA